MEQVGPELLFSELTHSCGLAFLKDWKVGQYAQAGHGRRNMLVSDDLGCAFVLPGSPERVVSLVPSLTESIARTVPEVLVGATDWCTHPADLDATRVRGTKNPDVATILGLRPDLVVANKEENRELDVRRLRQAGVPVWVTVIETVSPSDRVAGTALH